MSFTRRSHVVRIQAPPEVPVPDGSKPAYVDIEVLDAISYTTDQGRVHVWKCPSADAQPYIKDTTGDDPQWSAGGPNSSRGSHCKRIRRKAGGSDSDPDPKFDIEVLDRMAFTDEQGKIWALDYPDNPSGHGSDVQSFCVTDQSGNANSTRRTHLEVIKETYTDGGSGGGGGGRIGSDNPNNTGAKMVIERVDMIGFTGADEKKLIIKMPSADDGSSSRANTYISPPGYDPTNKDGPKPPLLEESGDKNMYFKFVVDNFPGSLGGTGPPTTEVGFAVYDPGITDPTNPFNASNAFKCGALLGGIGTIAEVQAGLEVAFPPPKVVVYTKIGGCPGIFSPPEPPSVSLGSLNAGDIKDPENTIKVSMGPLWWIRKFSSDGTD